MPSSCSSNSFGTRVVIIALMIICIQKLVIEYIYNYACQDTTLLGFVRPIVLQTDYAENKSGPGGIIQQKVIILYILFRR